MCVAQSGSRPSRAIPRSLPLGVLWGRSGSCCALVGACAAGAIARAWVSTLQGVLLLPGMPPFAPPHRTVAAVTVGGAYGSSGGGTAQWPLLLSGVPSSLMALGHSCGLAILHWFSFWRCEWVGPAVVGR